MKISSEVELREKIKVEIAVSAEAGAAIVADEIVSLVLKKEARNEKAVLGLPTGSTPVALYRELIRRHREALVSFRNVVTFNLDEYFPITNDHRESYRRFMGEQFFNHIDVPESQIHIPDGNLLREEVFSHCQEYEELIRLAGGIDLQILGIGRTGHIGFNEPGSSKSSGTRLVTLDRLTRLDAARDFLGEKNVPRHAITMGVGTVLSAKQVILIAWGNNKADIVARAVEGPVTESVSASFLQTHSNARFIVDTPAASNLTRINLPWLVGPVAWSEKRTRRAVCWLSSEVNKPVLKLLDEDYNENGMAELLIEAGPAYPLNIRIFNELQHSITGWPGGKPDADDTNRPERAHPFPKRVVVLSPEPMDDVVSMGGTLSRLVDQGHLVEVVYMTSGDLGVPDAEVGKFTNNLNETACCLGREWNPQVEYCQQIMELLNRKGLFDYDSNEVRQLKGLLRRAEVREACWGCGIDPEHVHFLDLPFYQKGHYRQFHLSDDDLKPLLNVLRHYQPHQIYITGNRENPISVQALCFELFSRAYRGISDEAWVRDCHVWLYSGREWTFSPFEVDMAVPMSPAQLAQKMEAIDQHQTQRSQTIHNAERDRSTACLYDKLGLAEYEAIEVFQRWRSELIKTKAPLAVIES